jgi:hypothetical protein
MVKKKGNMGRMKTFMGFVEPSYFGTKWIKSGRIYILSEMERNEGVKDERNLWFIRGGVGGVTYP